MAVLKSSIDWAASRVFMDNYDNCVLELDIHLCVLEEEKYKHEIEFAKEVVSEIPEYWILSFEEKLDIAKRMLVQLKEINMINEQMKR